MADSIFTKIINGEIPAHRVYEDDDTIGFLDIHPIQPGHTLIVSKKQIEQFTEMGKNDFQDIMQVSQKFAKHMQAQLGCQRVVLRIEGFDVPHVHVHLIPCNHAHDSFREGRENEEPDHNSLRKMAQKLKFEK